MPHPFHENPASVVDVFQSFVPGYRLVDGEDLLIQAQLLFSGKAGLRGGTDAVNAVPLDTYLNQVSIGTTSVLPPGLQGRRLVVINDSGNPLTVYASQYNPSTGMSDSVATASSSMQGASIVQNTGTVCEYICFENGLWKQIEGWAGGSGGTGGAVSEAPTDGKIYGRNGATGTWSSWVVDANVYGTNDGYSAPLSPLHFDEGTY